MLKLLLVVTTLYVGYVCFILQQKSDVEINGVV